MKLSLVQCQALRHDHILYTYRVKILYSRSYILELCSDLQKQKTNNKKVPSAKNTHARTSVENIIVLYLYTIAIPTCRKTKT